MAAAVREKRQVAPIVHFHAQYDQLYNNRLPAIAPAIPLAAAPAAAAAKKYPAALKKKQEESYVSRLRPRPGRAEPAKDAKGKGKGKVNEAEEEAQPKKRAAAEPKKVRARPRPRPIPRRRAFPPPPLFRPVPVPMEVDEPEVEVETPALKRKKEGIALVWTPQVKAEEFDVNLEHMKVPVQPLHEELPLEDINARQLLDIVDETDLPAEFLQEWKAYGGAGNLFQQKDDVKRALTTVINYCEDDATAGKGIKNKLRLVTKILKDDVEARRGVLVLLAQHGNVCNVMKEVAVHLSYSMLINNVKDFVEKQSLRSLVFRQLLTLRELVVEEIFIKSGNFMNTHPLVAFRNGLSEHTGLELIPDQHSAPNPADGKRIRFFNRTYSTARIVKAISVAINEKPRKIPYELVVEWLQQNSPKEDAYEFLSECFDLDSGNLTEAAVLYLLHKMEVLF